MVTERAACFAWWQEHGHCTQQKSRQCSQGTFAGACGVRALGRGDDDRRGCALRRGALTRGDDGGGVVRGAGELPAGASRTACSRASSSRRIF
jgi:hypothetical protein